MSKDEAERLCELQQQADQRHRHEQAEQSKLEHAGAGVTQRCPHCNASYRLVGSWQVLPPCHFCGKERE